MPVMWPIPSFGPWVSSPHPRSERWNIRIAFQGFSPPISLQSVPAQAKQLFLSPHLPRPTLATCRPIYVIRPFLTNYNPFELPKTNFDNPQQVSRGTCHRFPNIPSELIPQRLARQPSRSTCKIFGAVPNGSSRKTGGSQEEAPGSPLRD